MESNFKSKYSFESRKSESKRIVERYPDRIPVIIERSAGSDVNDIDKKKFLVPRDLNIGQFIYVVRKRIKVTPEKAIYIFIKNSLPPTGALVKDIYNQHKDPDGFLYLTFSSESTFGNPQF